MGGGWRGVIGHCGRPGRDGPGGSDAVVVDCLLALGGSFRRKLSLSNFGEHLSRYTVLVSIISFVVYTFAFSSSLSSAPATYSFYMVRQPSTTILIALHKIQLYFTRPRAPAHRKREWRTRGEGGGEDFVAIGEGTRGENGRVIIRSVTFKMRCCVYTMNVHDEPIMFSGIISKEGGVKRNFSWWTCGRLCSSLPSATWKI